MNTVRIYTASYCAWSEAAKDLLRSKRVYFEEIDVTGDLEMREKLAQMAGGMLTVPQIWIGDVHVGGYRDLVRLDERGELDPLLSVAKSGAVAMPVA